MFTQEDLKWIASTSTNLNSVLQQILRYADLARRHKEEDNFFELLGERVELGARTAQSLFDHITSNILEKSVAKAASGTGAAPVFTVLPSAPPGRPPTKPIPEPKKQQTATNRGPSPNASTTRQTRIPPEIEVLNPKGNREYVLIIEDDADIRELAADMLAEEGYKLILACDGLVALDMYRKIGSLIGLIILDFFLPVLDGDAVFDELRAINPSVNVVLSSGLAERDKVSAMLAQGLRGFIPKPYTREKLLEQVRTALDAARGTR
jgi:CheY-like chemotaxis protein